jgi:hypothetical protein
VRRPEPPIRHAFGEADIVANSQSQQIVHTQIDTLLSQNHSSTHQQHAGPKIKHQLFAANSQVSGHC